MQANEVSPDDKTLQKQAYWFFLVLALALCAFLVIPLLSHLNLTPYTITDRSAVLDLRWAAQLGDTPVSDAQLMDQYQEDSLEVQLWEVTAGGRTYYDVVSWEKNNGGRYRYLTGDWAAVDALGEHWMSTGFLRGFYYYYFTVLRSTATPQLSQPHKTFQLF